MNTATMAEIDTSPVDLRVAAAIEAAEARAWADMFAAAPDDFARAAGVSTRMVAGALVTSWAATGRRYFSRTIGLGVVEPASPGALDDVLAGYADAGIGMFLIPSQPHCRPSEFEDWLRDRGLEPFDAQDRVVRGGHAVDRSRAPAPGERGLEIEQVTASTADEWAEFLQRVYRLDTGPWLQALVGRAGWSQYVV